MVPFFKWCSIQNACKNGWFADKDSEELLSLADEIGSSFCSVRDMNTEANNYLQTISTIMSRFYPRMKMGQILAFLEVKPGYGTFAYDFHILKNAKPSAEDKVRLFVAQTDNIETSSCITTPPQVNFLLNGKGVDKRTNVFMDTGPQLPTVVMDMLKYGTNLLQVVGQFSGNYIIVVAYMGMISNLDRPVLQDCVQPAVAALDSVQVQREEIQAQNKEIGKMNGSIDEHFEITSSIMEFLKKQGFKGQFRG